MGSLGHRTVSFRYRLVYFFNRLRGRGAVEASASARSVAMRSMSRAIDARTQALAKNICANC